jgi:hypothetical protein
MKGVVSESVQALASVNKEAMNGGAGNPCLL